MDPSPIHVPVVETDEEMDGYLHSVMSYVHVVMVIMNDGEQRDDQLLI